MDLGWSLCFSSFIFLLWNTKVYNNDKNNKIRYRMRGFPLLFSPSPPTLPPHWLELLGQMGCLYWQQFRFLNKIIDGDSPFILKICWLCFLLSGLATKLIDSSLASKASASPHAKTKQEKLMKGVGKLEKYDNIKCMHLGIKSLLNLPAYVKQRCQIHVCVSKIIKQSHSYFLWRQGHLF